MVSDAEITQKWDEARLALLARIVKDTQDGVDAGSIKDLAEAFAWVTATQQDH